METKITTNDIISVLNDDVSNNKIKLEFEGCSFIRPKQKNHLRALCSWAVLNVVITEELLTSIRNAYEFMYSNKSCLDSFYSKDIRSPISKVYGFNSPEHLLSKQIVRIEYADKKQLTESQQAGVVERNSNITMFDKKTILKIITDGIDSSNIELKTISLLIASGCRPIELLAISQFRVRPDVGKQWVQQTGIAKSKTRNEIIKPLIKITPSRFINELKVIRGYYTGKFGSLVNQQGGLNPSINNILNSEIHKLIASSIYTCRKLYASLSYNNVGKNPNLYGNSTSLAVWLNHVLGHAEGELNTSNNYTNVIVK